MVVTYNSIAGYMTLLLLGPVSSQSNGRYGPVASQGNGVRSSGQSRQWPMGDGDYTYLFAKNMIKLARCQDIVWQVLGSKHSTFEKFPKVSLTNML